MKDNKIDLTNENQIIYIPSYVEEGIQKLKEAKDILEEIAKSINRGIRTINGSGYDRGIPYIEKGDLVSTAIEQMKDTIKVITVELERYNKGKGILPDDAIIIADPETARKYKIATDKIYCSLEDYAKNKVSPKWTSNYLTAAAGTVCYYGKDGRYTKETWCDLNPNYLVTLMKRQGIDLDFWIREDGVYMYGDYVMVAADIPHMDGTQQEAEYRKGDIVETSLGTGMVVDLCGMAENVRKGVYKGGQFGEVEVWYDIYTAWHDGGKYQAIGYSESKGSPITGEATLLKAGSNTINNVPFSPTLLNNSNHSTSQTPNTLESTTMPQSPNTPTSPTTPQSPSTPVLDGSNKTPNTNAPNSSISTPPVQQEKKFTLQNLFKSTTTQVNPDGNSVHQQQPSINTGFSSNAVSSNNYQSNTETKVETPNVVTNNNSNNEANLLTNNNSVPESTSTTYTIPTISGKSPETPKKAVNPVAILTSLGLATAAGVSSKIYLDNKSKNKSTTEEDEFKDDDEFDEEYDSINSDLITDEWIEESNEKQTDDILDSE